MTKIVCRLRKEKKCKEAPDVCEWDAVNQKCLPKAAAVINNSKKHNVQKPAISNVVSHIKPTKIPRIIKVLLKIINKTQDLMKKHAYKNEYPKIFLNRGQIVIFFHETELRYTEYVYQNLSLVRFYLNYNNLTVETLYNLWKQTSLPNNLIIFDIKLISNTWSHMLYRLPIDLEYLMGFKSGPSQLYESFDKFIENLDCVRAQAYVDDVLAQLGTDKSANVYDLSYEYILTDLMTTGLPKDKIEQHIRPVVSNNRIALAVWPVGHVYEAYDHESAPAVLLRNKPSMTFENYATKGFGIRKIVNVPPYMIKNDNVKSYDKLHHTHDQAIYKVDTDVRYFYVSTTGSKELNISLMYYLQERERISETLLKRVRSILDAFLKIDSLNGKYGDSFVVYHGTSQLIHKGREFTTCAFFSTTRSINVALKYAGGTNGFIYALKVPSEFPFINFDDNLEQILVPIGSTIKVAKVVKNEHLPVTFVLCELQPYEIDIAKQIHSIVSNPCFDDTVLRISEKAIHPLILNVPSDCPIESIKLDTGSSSFYKTMIKKKDYYIKDIVKRNDKIAANINSNQVLKRILNELLAARVYSDVFKLDTLDLFLFNNSQEPQRVKNASSYLISSQVVKRIVYPQIGSYTKTKENVAVALFEGFLIDCIMGNWDTYNNKNIGFKSHADPKSIRTDVGGAMAYRGKGDQNLQYVVGIEPRDHIWIMEQSSFKDLSKSIKDTDACIQRIKDKMKEVDRGFEDRLNQVHELFKGLVKTIEGTEVQKKYFGFIENILEVVKYRQQYYMENMDEVLKMVFVTKKAYIGGADGKLPKITGDITPGNVVTMKPNDFKKMLSKFDKCER